jgi:hypothetical protein
MEVSAVAMYVQNLHLVLSESLCGCCLGFVEFLMNFSGVGLLCRVLVRPHPVFWRFIHGIAVIYLIFLTFLLFQVRISLSG